MDFTAPVERYVLFVQCLKKYPTFGSLQLWHTWTDFDTFFGRNVTDKVGNHKMLYCATSHNLCFCTMYWSFKFQLVIVVYFRLKAIYVYTLIKNYAPENLKYSENYAVQNGCECWRMDRNAKILERCRFQNYAVLQFKAIVRDFGYCSWLSPSLCFAKK